MPRITVRFLVDDKQVDEVEAEVAKHEDVPDILKVLKESVPETVSDMTMEVDSMVQVRMRSLVGLLPKPNRSE